MRYLSAIGEGGAEDSEMSIWEAIERKTGATLWRNADCDGRSRYVVTTDHESGASYQPTANANSCSTAQRRAWQEYREDQRTMAQWAREDTEQ